MRLRPRSCCRGVPARNDPIAGAGKCLAQQALDWAPLPLFYGHAAGAELRRDQDGFESLQGNLLPSILADAWLLNINHCFKERVGSEYIDTTSRLLADVRDLQAWQSQHDVAELVLNVLLPGHRGQFRSQQACAGRSQSSKKNVHNCQF